MELLLPEKLNQGCCIKICETYSYSRKRHKIKKHKHTYWLGVFIAADNGFKLLKKYKNVTNISFQYVEMDRRYLIIFEHENVFQIQLASIFCEFRHNVCTIFKSPKVKNVSCVLVLVQKDTLKFAMVTTKSLPRSRSLRSMRKNPHRLSRLVAHCLPLRFSYFKDSKQRLWKMHTLSSCKRASTIVISVQESNDLQTETKYETPLSKLKELENVVHEFDYSSIQLSDCDFSCMYSNKDLFNILVSYLELGDKSLDKDCNLGIRYKKPLRTGLMNCWHENAGTALDSKEHMTDVNKSKSKESNNDHAEKSNPNLQCREVLREPENQDDPSYKRETDKEDDLKWIYKYNRSERLHYNSFLTLQVYPMFNQNTRPTLHNLMRHELFRVCSFAYSNPPVPETVQVTQLAQSGFYNLDDSGCIRCFFCGHECDVTNEESVEIAYRHHCRQQEQNVPLNEWTLGLNPTDQHPYFSLYGDRTPTLFALPDSGFEEGDDDQLEQITGATGFSEGVNTGDTRQTSSYSNSQSANDAVEGSVNPSHHSLPTNLNTVSGSIVIQESEDTQSSQVLTSKSLEPVNFSQTPAPALNVAEPPNTQAAEQSGGDAPVEGAVGGQATFDLGLASYPQFASSASRRATFTGWNPDHPQRPDDLVAGGFFYAGYADCVRCFNCGLGLKYWRPNDIPAYQHARFRPNCVYNKMYKGQEYIDKVQQDLREEQAAALALANANNQDNQVATPYTLPEPTQPPQPPAVPNVTPPSTDIEDHEYLRLPASQGALAAGWRREQIVQAVTNVVEEMGVVAQNVQLDILMDVLRELYSADQAPPLTGSNRNEEIISSSSVAEPSIASIRRPPPDTTFSDSSKLAEYRLREDAFEHNDGGPAAAEVPDSSDSPPSVGNPQEQYRAVERENAYLNQRTICGICHERPVSSIYLPCGHVLACQICAENESYCRACNRPIVATSNIYLS